MRRNVVLLIFSFVAALFAYSGWAKEKDVVTMTDQELKSALDSLVKAEQPLSAAPLIAEAKKRAMARKDTRWMLSLIADDINLNHRRRQRETTAADEIRRAIPAAWTPLRQLLYLDLYGRLGQDSLAQAALADSDELRSLSASEAGAEGWVATLNLLDYVAMSIALESRGGDDTPTPIVFAQSGDFAKSTEALPAGMAALRVMMGKAREAADNRSLILGQTLRVLTVADSDDASVDSLLDELASMDAKTAEDKALVDFAKAAGAVARAKAMPREEMAKAEEAIDQAMALYGNVTKVLGGSPFERVAEEQMEKISKRQVTLGSDPQVLPDAFVPVYIKHRNVGELTVKVLDAIGGKAKFGDKVSLADDLGRLKVVRSETLRLPKTAPRVDFSSAYVELGGVPVGSYVVAAYADGELVAASSFACSAIGVCDFGDDMGDYLLISDFKAGTPLKGAKVLGKGSVDADGWIKVKKKKSGEEVSIVSGNDSFRFSTSPNNVRADNGRHRVSAKVLTDRAIYRPGQKLSYKVFIFDAYADRVEPLAAKKSCRLTLCASNGKELVKESLTLDALGTAWGEMTVPTDAMKGRGFLLVEHSGRVAVRQPVLIEDFKRSDNTVEIDPFAEALLPGASASVTGSGVSAAGLPVVGAMVKYSISLRGKVVDEGETVSDAAGRYSFVFKTHAAERELEYSVEVRMTDIKGETATAQRFCLVTPRGTQIGLERYEAMGVVGRERKISLVSANANNQPYEATLHLRVTPYEAMAGLRPTVSHMVDTAVGKARHLVLGEETFDGNKPTLASKPIFESDYVVKGRMEIDLGEVLGEAGRYKVELTAKALDGSPLTAEADMIALAERGRSDGLGYLDLHLPNDVKAGDKLDIRVCTGLADAYVNLVVARRSRIVFRRGGSVSRGVEVLSFDVPAEAVDGEELRVWATVCKDGRTYNADGRVTVRGDEPRVKLTLKTFRDHSQPRAHEEWTLHCEGDGERAVVASMYDSRLDKYVGGDWDPRFRRVPVANWVSHTSVNPKSAYLVSRTTPIGYQRWWRADDYSATDVLGEALDGVAYHSSVRDLWGSRFVAAEGMAFASASPRMLGANKLATVEAVADMAEESAMADETDTGGDHDTEKPLVRDNFAETVFFLPNLRPDAAGDISFSFDLPDNLTTYNFRALLHDGKMRSSMVSRAVVVRNPLNVSMGVPRFLTEGDKVVIAADVTAADSTVGQALVSMSVEDAASGKVLMRQPDLRLSFADAPSRRAEWAIDVPEGVDTIRVEVVATAGTFADGERRNIPVSKRFQEVDESHSFVLTEKGRHKIENPFRDGVTTNLTFAYTSNAFIEVLRALPRLNDGWQPCADTYLGRFEAASIAVLLKDRPEIRKAVDYLRDNVDTAETPDRIAEADKTPWLYVARRLRQHDRNVVRIMSGSYAETEKREAIRKLAQLQLADGSIPWFAGMDGSAWMTVAVAQTLGEMIRLGVVRADEAYVSQICKKALPYLDSLIAEECAARREAKGGGKMLSPWMLSVLHARLLLNARPSADVESLLGALQDGWQYPSMCDRVTAATVLAHVGRADVAQAIVKSLEQNLVQTRDETAYIPEDGLFRRREQIEAQSMLVLTLQRLNPKSKNLPRLINHLVLMKRGEAWPDAQSTSRAVLALLGSSAKLAAADVVTVGGRTVECNVGRPTVNAVLPTDGGADVAYVQKGDGAASWGSWSRVLLAPKDELRADSTSKLKVVRRIEVRRMSQGQANWVALQDDAGRLSVGDQVRISLSLYNDEPLSFVCVRDFRAAALEPDDKLSGYRGWWWRCGVADADVPVPPHYLSVGDADMEFFVDYLNSGWHRLSYVSTVTHEGDFAGGYADATCMYSTDIKAHSDGIRIGVKN